LFVDFLEVCSKIRGFCTPKEQESPYSAFELLADKGEEKACILLAMRHVTDRAKFTSDRAADRARLQHLVAAKHPMAKVLEVLLGFNPVGEALLSNSPQLAFNNAFRRNASAMSSLSKLIKQDIAKCEALKAKLA
jgi:hypothetical protein